MPSAKAFLLLFFTLIFLKTAFADGDPRPAKKPGAKAASFRIQCLPPKAQADLHVNNVRARLTTGGDLWWDRMSNTGQYVVPQMPPGAPEVISIFASGIWLGGFGEGGNLKVACQTFGNSGNSPRTDFYPGPLSQNGMTSSFACENWDQFFEVKKTDVEEHFRLFEEARYGGEAYTADKIPLALKGWPAQGNPYFQAVHNFWLTNSNQGLADFWDEDGDGFYHPLQGDFPHVNLRTCEEYPSNLPDQMFFWVFNDEGGGAPHGTTSGDAIRMEVQAQAFAFATNDVLNDMTFYRYKLINRALEDIDSTYFAIWTDFNLGCWQDDYIGCDPGRSLAYAYNSDDEDGSGSVFDDCFGQADYGRHIPVVGIDLFRGPLNESREEVGMTNFMYYVQQVIDPVPPAGMGPPETDVSFYNYMTGSWKDGSPLVYGQDGYDPSATSGLTNFAFPSEPSDAGGWSGCQANQPHFEQYAIQSAGPFTLQPGAVNELVYGVVWVPDMEYPCPDLTRFKQADDLAQCMFDDCFELRDEVDAPDVDWCELNRELVAVLSNNPPSNNLNEEYEGLIGCVLPPFGDSTYNFEGYILYQLKNSEVTYQDLGDSEKARIAGQCDLKNGIGDIYNWKTVYNPASETDPNAYNYRYEAELKVAGADEGICDTFRITEDLFAENGDRRLLNHRKYYFMAIAYAYNNYLPFDPEEYVGQTESFMYGKRNIRRYTLIPRPAFDSTLQNVNVVPNPYRGFSEYETGQNSAIVKITNLPAKCTVTIYTLDGKFVRQFKRDEIPTPGERFDRKILPDLEWDLKNSHAITIASGIYLIHIHAPGFGERTLKWFGMTRGFDATGF